ncbi:MAG: molecular chaperone TorD family protein [Nitrospinae bacterium]|nr:molecular chaperone TorD family protein [Nitrospinota bacterium]
MKKIDNTSAEIYRTLSEIYKEPDMPFAEAVCRGDLYDVLNTYLKELKIEASIEDLKIAGETNEVFERLKSEYYPLFVGPVPPFALPVESVYKEWTAEEGAILSKQKGLLMGDSAIDMINIYKAEGIEVPPAFNAMPDHITLLLEYTAHLCESASQDEQKKFISDHFDWLPDFGKDVFSLSKSKFYRCAVDVTLKFIQNERQILEIY